MVSRDFAAKGFRCVFELTLANERYFGGSDDGLRAPRWEQLIAATVAARAGVTPRAIQMLFESAGGTFSEYLLEQRLACAHRMLTGPRHFGWTISAIAFGSGFGDLSYFNRTFRRRFEATPSEVREAAGLRS